MNRGEPQTKPVQPSSVTTSSSRSSEVLVRHGHRYCGRFNIFDLWKATFQGCRLYTRFHVIGVSIFFFLCHPAPPAGPLSSPPCKRRELTTAAAARFLSLSHINAAKKCFVCKVTLERAQGRRVHAVCCCRYCCCCRRRRR